MTAFLSTLNQMSFLFLCILIGFILNKCRILSKDADVTISRLENYVFVPALIINSFYQYCTPSNLSANRNLLFYNIIILAVSILTGLVLAPRFAKKPEDLGIFRYSLAVVNFGFMGNSLVQGLFGDAELFRYLIFTLPGNLFTYSVGVVWLTSGKEKFSFRKFINPMFISMLIGMIMGLTQIPLPSFLTKTINACAGCFSPLAMILTGFVIGKFDLKKLASRIDIYVLTAIRVVAMPLVFLFAARLLHVPSDIQVLMIFFTAMPLGLNTIVFPAAYGTDTTPGASMAVISNVIGLVTVPLILSLIL